jgi:Spy/CpxP family protein refolding chaperone
MKNKLIILVFLFSFSLTLFAQREEDKRREDFEKFKAQRTEYISKEMGLTPEQANAFWPLCDGLQQKKFQLNKELRELLRKIHQRGKTGTKATDDDYERIVNLSADTKIKEAELDKEYIEKFKTVVSFEQILKYQRAEMHFARTFFDKDKPQPKKGTDNK